MRVAAAVGLPLAAVGALALLPRVLASREQPLEPELEAKLQELLLHYNATLLPAPARLDELDAEFRAQMRQGLSANVTVDGKRLLMLPTFVTRLPDGTETGECYALDLGGTNFRVMAVRLGAGVGEVASCQVEEVALPREVYTGSGAELFDFLAATLKSFIDRHQAAAPGGGKASAALPVLGFCFSFAVQQTGLAAGLLLDWTKGFTCSGVVGRDPVALLGAALERAGRPCRVAVLLNDTVGVLAAQRYLDASTELGVILGTGTNACYVERLEAMTKWTRPAAGVGPAAGQGPGGGHTAVNTEWGAFFCPQLPRCLEDLQVDAASPHPGRYLFEKLLSGMYLGEVARRILFTIAKEVPGLFAAPPADAAAAAADSSGAVNGGGALMDPRVAIPGALATPGSLSTASLAAIVEDGSWRLRATRRRLAKELGVHAPGLAAARVAREVCTLVARRSAVLTAMGLLAVLKHSGWGAGPEGAAAARPVTVAFDGGVYERFGAFRTMLAEAVRAQAGEELAGRVRFVLSHDGSALGAAVLAAAAVAAGN